jgi:DNA polymerase III sliding clamp (beta) subunit (PCNA family)
VFSPGGAGTASCALSGQMLAAALGQVLFAAAAQAELPALTGVLLETKDDSLRLVATDRYRLAVRDIVPDRPVPVRPLRALVSASALAELRTQLAGVDTCALWPSNDGGLRADLDGAIVCLAPVIGPFPDYEQVLLGITAGHHGLVGRSALADAFDGLDHPAAELTFARTELLVRAGQRTAAVEAHWDGPDLTMTVNPVFVAQALAAQVGPDVAIEATDALRPITFRSADAGTLSVLVMPIRAET